MVLTKLIIREVFGIIGNFISIGLFASPVTTFYRVIKNNLVQEVEPEYYLLTTMHCLVLMLYGMPFIHPGSILLLTANGIGLAMHLAYLIIFLLYAKDNKQRMYIGCVCLIELAVVGLAIGLVFGVARTLLARTAIVGVFCFVFGTMMYWPRVSHVATVSAQNYFDYMSFPVVMINILNDLCWLIYASIRFDNSLWWTYFTGFSVGVVQIIYGGLYKCTSKFGDELATTEGQLRGIVIDDVHKKLIINEVEKQMRSQKIDT